MRQRSHASLPPPASPELLPPPARSQGITNLSSLSGLTVLNRMGTTARSAIRHATSLPALRCLRLMDRAFPAALSALGSLTSLELRIGRVPQDRVEEACPRSRDYGLPVPNQSVMGGGALRLPEAAPAPAQPLFAAAALAAHGSSSFAQLPSGA